MVKVGLEMASTLGEIISALKSIAVSWFYDEVWDLPSIGSPSCVICKESGMNLQLFNTRCILVIFKDIQLKRMRIVYDVFFPFIIFLLNPFIRIHETSEFSLYTKISFQMKYLVSPYIWNEEYPRRENTLSKALNLQNLHNIGPVKVYVFYRAVGFLTGRGYQVIERPLLGEDKNISFFT